MINLLNLVELSMTFILTSIYELVSLEQIHHFSSFQPSLYLFFFLKVHLLVDDLLLLLSMNILLIMNSLYLIFTIILF